MFSEGVVYSAASGGNGVPSTPSTATGSSYIVLSNDNSIGLMFGGIMSEHGSRRFACTSTAGLLLLRAMRRCASRSSACVSGLVGQTAAHIHGPASRTATAGVLVTLPVGT
jgi:hypothetical protein